MKSQKSRLQMHVKCTFYKRAECSARKIAPIKNIFHKIYYSKICICSRLHVLYILNVLVLITNLRCATYRVYIIELKMHHMVKLSNAIFNRGQRRSGEILNGTIETSGSTHQHASSHITDNYSFRSLRISIVKGTLRVSDTV